VSAWLSAFADEKTRRWDLISPEKIF